tara:strand:- start:2237 stop:2389 length:153 start_codon:yes stop_codon:yes gene_type:complete
MSKETFNTWAAEAQEHLEQLEEAKKEGICVHCGVETDDGECGQYKCWIYA